MTPAQRTRSSFGDDAVTQRLRSMTHPESGTTTFDYNADGTLLRRNDARGSKLEYTYDGLGRRKRVNGFNPGETTFNQCESREFYYDTNPLDGAFTANGQGRLTAVELAKDCGQAEFVEMYSYTAGGLATKKRLRYAGTAATPANLDAVYSYDNEGRMRALTYPAAWQVADPNAPVPAALYTYSYDGQGRPNGLVEERGATDRTHASGVSYNAADQITAITYLNQAGAPDTYYTETRQYNARLQMTRMTVAGVVDFELRYSATQNDGQISSRKDFVSGEEIAYQYDSLQRLVTAATTGAGGWGLSFTYDGFGNKTAQTVTKGSGPGYSLSINAANNRINGRSYDASGNLTHMPYGGTTTGLAWTPEATLRGFLGATGDENETRKGCCHSDRPRIHRFYCLSSRNHSTSERLNL